MKGMYSFQTALITFIFNVITAFNTFTSISLFRLGVIFMKQANSSATATVAASVPRSQTATVIFFTFQLLPQSPSHCMQSATRVSAV